MPQLQNMRINGELVQGATVREDDSNKPRCQTQPTDSPQISYLASENLRAEISGRAGDKEAVSIGSPHRGHLSQGITESLFAIFLH